MLETIRNFTKGPIAVALLSLLIISFGAWGIGDILRVHGEPPVARVADQTISAADLQQAFERRIALIREREDKTFDAEQARAMGFDRRILEELIRLKAFDQVGADLGITVPDALIAKGIQENPDLKTGNTFDRAKFENWLRENNLTEDRYVALLRSFLTEQALLSALGGGLTIPKTMANPLITYQAERRAVRYLTLPPDAAGPLPPVSDADIAKLYETSKERFMAPEYRRLTYIDINPAEIAKTLAAKEEEIRARYEQHKADYAAPEKRKLEQLIYQDEAGARAAAEALKSGKSFVQVAAAAGKAPADIDIGEKTRTGLSPKLADAVFAAPADGVAGPLEGEFGWTLVHVVKVIPATQKSLADVRDQIAKDIAKDKAGEEAYKLATRLEDAREGDKPLDEAAKSAGLGTVTVEAVDHEGNDPKGAPVAALAGKTAILDDGFKSQVGEYPEQKHTADGAYYLVRVDSVTPPAQKPLAAVSAEIRKDLEGERRMKLLEERAKGLAARAKAGETLDALGTSIGHAPQTTKTLRRQEENETFSPEALAQIFKAPQGGVIIAPVKQGEGVVLAQVSSIEKPSMGEIAAIYQNAQQQRQGEKALGNEIASEYAEALVGRFKVKIDEEAFKRALGGV